MTIRKNNSKGSLEALTACFPNHGNSKWCLVFKGQKVLEEKCEKGTKVRSALNMKYNTYITLMSDRQSCKTSSIETFHDGWEARE